MSNNKKFCPYCRSQLSKLGNCHNKKCRGNLNILEDMLNGTLKGDMVIISTSKDMKK